MKKRTGSLKGIGLKCAIAIFGLATSIPAEAAFTYLSYVDTKGLAFTVEPAFLPPQRHLQVPISACYLKGVPCTTIDLFDSGENIQTDVYAGLTRYVASTMYKESSFVGSDLSYIARTISDSEVIYSLHSSSGGFISFMNSGYLTNERITSAVCLTDGTICHSFFNYFNSDGSLYFILYGEPSSDGLRRGEITPSFTREQLAEPGNAVSFYNGERWTLSIIGPGGQLAPAIPEPASWAMMFCGVGAIGSIIRRRQKVRTSVSFA